jgi:hypothetical protein
MKLRFFTLFALFLLISSVSVSNVFEPLVNKGEISVRDTISTKSNVSDSDSLEKKKKAYPPLLSLTETKLDSSQRNYFLTQEQVEKKDYTFTGELFRYLPFGIIRDFGSMGQPDEILIYGQGYGNIGYSIDGVPYNHRLTNSLELNHLQSESIDSLEVLPVYSGFFYNNHNEPAGVNMITRKRFDSDALTRIRFYQAPDDEGYLDIYFNRLLTNKINLTLDLTNNSIISRYENSGSGGWKASGRLDYLLFKKLTISANYRYYKIETDLNGGVDLDSIRNSDSPLSTEEALYDPLIAPVKTNSRYQRNLKHYFNVVINNKLIEDAPMRLTFYKDYSSNKYKQNMDLSTSEPRIVNKNAHSLLGFDYHQKFDIRLLNFELNFNYEDVSYEAAVIGGNLTKTNLSAGIKASQSLFNDMFYFAGFSKFVKSGDFGYSGFGGEARINFNDISLFGGASYFENPFNPVEGFYLTDAEGEVKTKNFAFQIGSSHNTANTTISLSYFYLNRKNNPYAVGLPEADSSTFNQVIYSLDNNKEIQGFNLNFNINYWKLVLESNASYYLGENTIDSYSLPKWTAFAGIYYVDSLFDNNLKLKAGLNYFGNSSKNYLEYDFQHYSSYNKVYNNGILNTISSKEVPAHHRLDFFVAGNIQRRATVYVAFENLLDQDYYDIPYYPVRGRNFRFGIAWELYN